MKSEQIGKYVLFILIRSAHTFEAVAEARVSH